MSPKDPERRTDTQSIGTPEHFRWLKGVVAVILILNVADAVLTTIWIWTGVATEANPVLAQLAHEDPGLFMAVKFLLVGLGTLLLWRQRKRPVSVVSLFLGFMLYYFILLYHLRSMNLQLLDKILG